VERQPGQESIEFRLAAGPVQAEDRGRARSLPDAAEMPLACQSGGGDGFCALTLLDLGFGVSSGTWTANSTRNSRTTA
jgi:hypothetical protein